MAASDKNLDKREIKEEKQDSVLMEPRQVNVTIKEEQDHEFTEQDQYRHEVKEKLDPDFVDQQHCSSGVKQENQESHVLNYDQNFVNQDHIKSDIKGETQRPDISDHNYHRREINEQNRNQDQTRSYDPTEPTDKQDFTTAEELALELNKGKLVIEGIQGGTSNDSCTARESGLFIQASGNTVLLLEPPDHDPLEASTSATVERTSADEETESLDSGRIENSQTVRSLYATHLKRQMQLTELQIKEKKRKLEEMDLDVQIKRKTLRKLDLEIQILERDLQAEK